MITKRKSAASKSTEILVVEDSITQATQIKHLLENHHYKVTVAHNGGEALNKLLKHKPALVISDIMMPRMNGYELCKKIKSNKKTEDIPVILLTVLADPKEIIEGLSCGADSFITKPYDKNYLLSHVKRTLSGGNIVYHEKVPFDAQILFKGKKRYIQTEQQNVIKLVISIYEGAIHQNEKLLQTQEELKLLNERLESMVLDRTADLTEEIKLSNQIAERLKESEERFRNLYNDAIVGLYRTNSNGEILMANRALIEILGFQSFEELAYRNLNETGYGKSYQRQVFIDQIEKEGEVKDLEAIWICRDGREIFIKESAKAICDSEGKILYYDGSIKDITEQKLAEAKLQETNEYLTNLFNHSNVPIIVWNTSLYITRFNNAFEHLSGYSSEEVVGKKVDILFPKEKIESSLDLIKRALGGERWENVEIEIQTKDGDTRIVLWNSSNILDKDGKTIVAVISQGNDITRRKQGEVELKMNQSQLMNALKIAHLGPWEYDVENDTFLFNDLFYAIFRTTAEQVGGYKMKSADYANRFVHPEDMATVGTEISKAIETDDPDFSRQLEHRIIYADGETGYITVRFFIEKNNKGKTVRTFGVNQDITERKRAEKVLRDSEEKYRGIFENVQDMFYEASIDGIIREVSPSIELISKGQYKREDVIGKSLLDFVNDPVEAVTMMTAIQKHGFISDYEVILKNRDGSSIPCSISSKVFFDVNKHPEKIIGSMRDITDRKNASDALKYAKDKAEASDRLKTTFLNNISHEVRTPLNGILGFAEIMSQTDLSEEEKQVSLSMLFESSDRLLTTITNYMDISLITSGNLTVNRRDFIPEKIMKELLGKYKTMCSGRNLELLLKLPEHADKLSINSDPEILTKTISHLLSNAIKFTEKGSIQYGYMIRDNELEFFVKDTGIGIGKESLNDVFEKFIKEDRGPLKITEGSGLGLSISKGLVELLGGRIFVESEIGKGSCFFFTIPRVKESEIRHSITKTGSMNKKKTIKSILVAEDDEVNYFYINSILKKNTSADIIHASNGQEAIDKFKENPDISLVLMDIKMPVMDGLTATREIKAIKREVPVIAVTAYATTGDEVKALNAGCDSYLAKPINRKQLLEKIAEFISL